MAFWDVFKTAANLQATFHSELHRKVSELLPGAADDDLINVTCVAGLLARVAWCDMEIHDGEVENMRQALKKWTDFSDQDANAVVELTLAHVRELAGLENHKYTEPLNERLNNNQRYGILISLFSLAASDGIVEDREAEEIRLIAKGLLLEHKHFISAKATVIEYLGSLRK